MESIATEKNIPFCDSVAGPAPYLMERLRRICNLAQGSRFEEAITAVAGIRPVLADSLRRAQDFVSHVPVEFVPQNTDTAESPDLRKTDRAENWDPNALLYHWTQAEKRRLGAP